MIEHSVSSSTDSEFCVFARSNHLLMYQIRARYPYGEHLCKPWYAVQAAVVQLLQCAIDLILMIGGTFGSLRLSSVIIHRCVLLVHALYNRNKFIAIFLIFMFIAEVLTMIMCSIFAVMNLHCNPLCLLDSPSHSYIYLAYAQPCLLCSPY